MISNAGVSLVRPFILAHLVEMPPGPGSRRLRSGEFPDRSAIGPEQVVSRADRSAWRRRPARIAVVVSSGKSWGFSPVGNGGPR